MGSLLVVGILIASIVLGAPVGFAMLVVSVGYVIITGALPLETVPYQMYQAIAHVPLIAVPFFMLTGELMNEAKITDRLLDLSREIVGRVRGGLAQVSVLVSMLFAGMNGSAVADTAAVGGILIPAMKKRGYPARFAAALIATCGTIGGIIPPSIVMILLASALSMSASSLFAAGLVPGIVVGLAIMLVAFVISARRGYERLEEPFSMKRLGWTFARASLALLVPMILVVGILGGVFGSVEAGAVTAMAALVIGGVCYRTLSLESIMRAVSNAARTSASVFVIIAASGPFGWLLSRLGTISFLNEWLVGLSTSPVLFILAILVIMLIAGMVLDIVANIVVLGPPLVYAMVESGFNEYQAALAVCVGFLIGNVTPPVGISLFTTSVISEERLERVALAAIPFILAEGLVLALILVAPELSLWLPSKLGLL